MGVYTKVAGVSHKQEVLKKLKVGDYLKLKREKNNSFDKNAILVFTIDNKELGYINKYQNTGIAQDMDRGKEFNVMIESISGLDKEFLGCNIHIYEQDNKHITINDGFTKFKVNNKFVSFEFQNQVITMTKDDFKKCYKHLMELEK